METYKFKAKLEEIDNIRILSESKLTADSFGIVVVTVNNVEAIFMRRDAVMEIDIITSATIHCNEGIGSWMCESFHTYVGDSTYNTDTDGWVHITGITPVNSYQLAQPADILDKLKEARELALKAKNTKTEVTVEIM